VQKICEAIGLCRLIGVNSIEQEVPMNTRISIFTVAATWAIIPVTTNVVLTEFQRTWARPDSARWGALYRELVPHYRAVNESYQNAQTAARRQATSK
jgi:hypothetical protein